MKFNKSDITPNAPRPLSSVCVGVTSREDARWRGISGNVKVVNVVHRMKLQRAQRDKKQSLRLAHQALCDRFNFPVK